MKRTRDVWIGAAFLILIAALTMGQKILTSRAVAEAAGAAAGSAANTGSDDPIATSKAEPANKRTNRFFILGSNQRASLPVSPVRMRTTCCRS